MKKAKSWVFYLACGVVIAYLVVCILSMSVYLFDGTAEVYFFVYRLLFRGARFTVNAVLACIIARVLLGNLETEIHRRDLTGYVLFPLAYTLQWAGNYLYDGRSSSFPWYAIVTFCVLIFGPFLIAEIGLFIFFRKRGKENYPQGYEPKYRPVKRSRSRFSWKKLLFVIVVLVLLVGFAVLFLTYGSQGCRIQVGYYIDGYELSRDGTAITVTIDSPISFYTYPNELVFQRDGNKIYATAYYNIAIFDWLYDAGGTFQIPLDDEVTEIWFCDYRSEGFELSLKKDDDDSWLIRRWDGASDSYIWVNEELE